MGDVPVLGALFRSSRFRRSETELMIIITPYLVKPTSGTIPLPTDGYKAATDASRVFLGQSFTGDSGQSRPVPTMAPPQVRSAGEPQAQAAPLPQAPRSAGKKTAEAAPAPGFTLK